LSTNQEVVVMRRLIVLGALFASLLLVGTNAAAAGNAFRFSAKGPGAEAFWSTFPESGNPVPGVIYTDTFVFTAEQAVRENSTRTEQKFLFIDQFSYKVDNRGNFIAVSDTFGEASGADVTLSVGSKLTSASVSATVALTTCTFGRTGECADAGTVTVNVTWTGQGGDLVRRSETFRASSKTFTEVFRFRGTFRDAIATGRLNGTSLGTSQFADIFNASSAELFICHGC
jgi:hypothetical protein